MLSAILLAAGRGERLRPLTDTCPKPLIEINSKPLIVHHLENLARAGITQIVINLSYLASQIQKLLGNGHQFGVTIHYSLEPDPLETGGGIHQALPLLGDRPFLVIAADIYTDYPFAALASKCQTLAHLVLVPNPTWHPKGDFSLDNKGFLHNSPQYTYASFGVIHADLFKNCPSGRFSLTPLLRQAATQKQATGEIYNGLWHNVGNVEELQNLKKKFHCLP